MNSATAAIFLGKDYRGLRESGGVRSLLSVEAI